MAWEDKWKFVGSIHGIAPRQSRFRARYRQTENYPPQAGPKLLPRRFSHGWALPNRCKRNFRRNLLPACVNVMDVSGAFADVIVRATVEAAFLVLVLGRNVRVGPLA